MKIRRLNELSAEEKKEIVYRSGLDFSEIIEKTIRPMAEEFAKSPYKSLRKYTELFDKSVPDKFVLSKSDLEKAYRSLNDKDQQALKAFEQAAQNIRAFHEAQKPSSIEVNIAKNTLRMRFVPYDRVALYVPGGKALYPSTVLMGLIPAQVAGVDQIILASPPSKKGSIANIIAAVAYQNGATAVLQAGGAQAIFACAYGIEELSLPPVDFIYGPGNVYVAAAKAFLSSQNICGIDSFAGPSEVLILADSYSNPEYLAQDLLAQAEHDENAIAILLTTDEKIAKQTEHAIEKILMSREKVSPRAKITKEAIEKNGQILICDTLEDAIEFSNEFAPEHLEIQTKDAETVAKKIKAAGSVFIGEFAPVAIGDYYSGTNHILPTNRGARFHSGVSTLSFYRRITEQVVSREGLFQSALPITLMSLQEGLFDEHGHSVLARFSKEELKNIEPHLPYPL